MPNKTKDYTSEEKNQILLEMKEQLKKQYPKGTSLSSEKYYKLRREIIDQLDQMYPKMSHADFEVFKQRELQRIFQGLYKKKS